VPKFYETKLELIRKIDNNKIYRKFETTVPNCTARGLKFNNGAQLVGDSKAANHTVTEGYKWPKVVIWMVKLNYKRIV